MGERIGDSREVIGGDQSTKITLFDILHEIAHFALWRTRGQPDRHGLPQPERRHRNV